MHKLILSLATIVLSLNISAQELQSKFNWHNLDYEQDGVRGMSVERAYKELLQGRKSETVIVGVIDSGVDIEHEDLKDHIWVNRDEIPDNGIDDDNNGFIDDMNGWDFIGGPDGQDVKQEQLESARLMVKYDQLFGEKPKKRKIKKYKEEYAEYLKIKGEIEEKKQEAAQYLPMYEGLLTNFTSSEDLLKEYLETESLSKEAVEAIKEADADIKIRQAKKYWLYLVDQGASKAAIQEGIDHFKGQLNYNYNPDFNPRAIVGDNPEKLQYAKYGNNEVIGPRAMHGTHVSGIIAADRANEKGVKGVADNVEIMVVRTVPDGDERDKDVANAIRYAADNGAQIVNMSFGKPYSPEKNWVDDAVKYAESKGVLLIAAAGNDNADIDIHRHYPTKFYKDGGEANNWITVGALSYKEGDEMVATFSNYGDESVDVFAPGVAIYSTVPGSKYEEKQGTSMAAPAVTGVAALLKSYFPTLTAGQLKQIILESSDKFNNQQVQLPGGGDTVAFGELSTSAGVVNAYKAVKLAMELTRKQ
ncbi:S8 family peptidase [Jiulongibacter sediminis]|uniref:Peptidase S8 n=1 Tax=Jiulongibacter sediminis TaxID=1605367 RepID=A0A0P7BSK5_9BACT|nr:S8 family peptidase [Jiulongibacter sediminis]KPM47923.1 peptidase S8 [Jiulongibacter sediminis]TBX24106.1 peptidase S8 [Jiulongibacter sediminis]